jgi:tetratricopeptide (TPR) repeat protein
VSGKELFNTACKNCHGGASTTICSADPLIKKKANDNCVSCHMPSNSTTDIPHVSVHDHRIGLHRPKISKEGMKKFLGINCINNPDVDKETKALAFIQYVEKFGFEISLLDSAMNYLSNKSSADIRKNFKALVHIAYLRNDVSSLRNYLKNVPDAMSLVQSKSYDNRDAWTAYRIAELLKKSGESSAAGQWFKRAYDLAPLHAEFANKYASDLAEQQQLGEAAKLFVMITKEHPEFAPAWSNYGYLVLLRDRNTTLAHQLIDKAIQLDPDYEQGLLNKAAVFLVEGKANEARQLVLKILKINPDNVQAKQALSRLNAS